MSKNIRDHFSKTVGDYDTVADKVVIKNGELHENLVAAIPFAEDRAINVLDLGCGTGHGMSLILKKYPRAKVTGIDFSDQMIQKSRQHLTDFTGRIGLIHGDFTEVKFPKKCDAVVSAVAIHNISHREKDKLFGRIFNALIPGGVFINADFVEGEVEELNKAFRKIYENFIRSNLQKGELKAWLNHAFTEDMPMKLTGQFQLLRKHGFKNCRKLWQVNNEVVYRASR